jgi:ketosteroid isomerase-like protein
MRYILMLLLLGTFTSWPFSPAIAQQSGEQQIRTLLQKQTIAWNQGDINSFMQTYWRSDSLLFIGKTGLTYGWQPTLDNYKKSYPDTAAMGKLTFNLLEFKSLSPDIYFVVGKWHLQRTIGDVQGHFSLVVKKINGAWKIIADHSS